MTPSATSAHDGINAPDPRVVWGRTHDNERGKAGCPNRTVAEFLALPKRRKKYQTCSTELFRSGQFSVFVRARTRCACTRGDCGLKQRRSKCARNCFLRVLQPLACC